MAIGFNVRTGPMSREQLARIASAGFRPPGPMSMPTMQVPTPPQAPRSTIGQGIVDLAAGLAALRRQGGSRSPLTPAPVTPGGPPVQPGQITSTSAIDHAIDPSRGSQQPLGGPPPGSPMGPSPGAGGSFAGNPYMSILQGPDWRSTLANMLIGVGAGISQAAADNMPWYSGIAPGIQIARGMNERDKVADYQHRKELAAKRVAQRPKVMNGGDALIKAGPR